MTNEEGQIEPTPSSPEAPSPEEVPQQTVQQPVEEADTQTQDELPEGVTSDHAKKRFQQLSEKAKTAEQALQDLRQRKSVFDEFLPQQQPTYQAPFNQQPQVQDYVDELGNVDIQRLNQALSQAQQVGQMNAQQAQAAMAYAQQVDRRMQEREAYSKYPELDPVAKTHDDDFKQLVADRMARNWAMGINKPLVEVADDVSRVYAKRQTEEAVAKKAVEQFKEAQVNRQQGPVEKQRSASREEVGVEKLREITRRGTPEQQEAAIAERLKRAGM